MAYFPFFMDIDRADGLIVGGGTVALRKAEKLLPYGPRLTVAAPDFCPGLEALEGVALLRRSFDPSMPEGRAFVIAATDERAVNREVGAICRERGIPVNVVDDREACTFLFPALVQDGPLSVGISTGGASPVAAIWLKKQVSALLPDGFGALLTYLDTLRERAKETLPTERCRTAFFSRVFETCLTRGFPLGEEEIQAMLESAREIALRPRK